MKQTRPEFIKLCISNEILMFGDFRLKSGRSSPYFFNAGKFSDGLMLGQLADHLGAFIVENLGIDLMLYGPAYKGIPIAAATAVNISKRCNTAMAYAYNRKEAKNHGEGGNTVGAPIRGPVVVIDDVITAGTSVHESLEVISAAGATLRAVVTILDRQETADGSTLSTAQILENELNVPVLSLIRLDDLVQYLESDPSCRGHLTAMNAYREKYGVE
ncbi:MAG: orotate phosphoribosyltransferase [Gammaproteobacteria bacterium]|nr:orotate phosphoribosyltransferase [Gammaproteobacteria bacterium]MYD75195.1 orotate phosphoribosyltransferase [Gammaproteobacteria bacterium]MYJ52091.1 orotate phosphoribosyltransferase [Gammaproteobacteria bacterium]